MYKLKEKIKLILTVVIVFVTLTVLGTVIFLIFSLPPKDFPSDTLITIEKGDTLSDISEKLHNEGYIKSQLIFRNLVILMKGERSINAGDYYFSGPESVFSVSFRFSSARHGLDPVRVIIFEGWNIFRIAEELDRNFDNIKFDEVIEFGREGYLFPDTYFITPNIDSLRMVELMERNFQNRIEPLLDEIENSPRTLEEILIMASILETEANTVESKRKIADILWKRFDIGMPLQVDASFSYVNNKNTYQLTLDDLKIEHPYNTYRNVGLPPTPISNPGLDSIKAAIDPIENDYWYFLSDLSGNMYYARDFDEHQYNRVNFLRQ